MEYKKRWYRQLMQSKRFVSFTVTFKDTDLWIGVDKNSYHPSIKDYAQQQTINYRNQLEEYIRINPVFKTSFFPLSPDMAAPVIASSMIDASQKASVGPMAAVAGAFADFIGNDILKKFLCKELIIENGGDLFIKIIRPIEIAVFAGNSPLSNKVGIEICAEDSPLGVCTSSATVGPSISFGKTDATMIVCKTATLADAYASYYGNMIKIPEEINQTIEKIQLRNDIYSALIVCQDKMGICGKYKLKLLANTY